MKRCYLCGNTSYVSTCSVCKRRICPSHANINGDCIVITENGNRYVHTDIGFDVAVKQVLKR